MKDDRIFTSDDIKKLTKDIKKLKFDNHTKEKFAQIIYNDIPIPYLISTYGRVLSVNYAGKKDRVRVLKTKIQGNGYVSVSISINECTKTLLVHRLVALAFIPNKHDKEQVNHEDGNKQHNYIWNLTWCTPKENHDHAIKYNLKKYRKGEEIGDNKFTSDMVRNVCILLSENNLSFKEISDKTGVSYDMVRNIRNYNSWTHISKEYDFSNYNGGKKISELEEKINNIHKVCMMLESNNFTIKKYQRKPIFL